MSITTIALAVVLGLPLIYGALVIINDSVNYLSVVMAARRRSISARRRYPL